MSTPKHRPSLCLESLILLNADIFLEDNAAIPNQLAYCTYMNTIKRNIIKKHINFAFQIL